MFNEETMNAIEDLQVVCEDEGLMVSYKHEGDAGLDLRSAEDFVLGPGSRKLVDCGIKIKLPEGTVGMVCPRSGLAGNHGITIVNAPGIVDSGYTGQIRVILLNTDQNASFEVKKGDRIAQLVVVPYISCKTRKVEQLEDTERGENGFGSSGVK